VLNVQPDDIVGDVKRIKIGVHLAHICLIPVVPAALVVPQREILGQRSRACDLSVLLCDLNQKKLGFTLNNCHIAEGHIADG
jgi:hypothetical protein